MQLLKHFHKLSIHPKNASELKGLILQLAIQGKLTADWRKQNPSIEPACELYKQIELEKKRLINLNKIKKEKGLPRLSKEEIPYEIPEKWNWRRLVELSSINGGFAFKSSNYIDEGARVIRISDFDENGFKNHKIVKHLYSDALKSYVLEDKNILIAMTGGTVGKSLFVDKVPELMVVNQRVATIKIFRPINEAYINCVIPTKLIQDVIEEAKNSTNDNISMSNIKGFKIPLPPLEEQKEIVRIVDVFFKEVNQLESLTKQHIKLKHDYVASALHQLATQNTKTAWQELTQHFSTFFDDVTNIKKLRETILQLAVQGKLTADWRNRHPELVEGQHHASELLKSIQQEKAQLIKEKKIKKEKALPPITSEEIPYELPEGWVWCRFQCLILDIEAGKSPKCDPESANLEKWGVIKMSAVSWGNFDPNENKSLPIGVEAFAEKEIKSGDFILTRANTSELIAKSVIVPNSVRPKLLLNDKTLRINFTKNISVQYLNLYNNGSQARVHYKSVSTGTSDSMQNISRDNIKLLKVPLPPLEEQKAIVEKVNALMGLCDELEHEVNTGKQQLEDLMQSVLREVFEGKQEVKHDTLPMAAEPEGVYVHGN